MGDPKNVNLENERNEIEDISKEDIIKDVLARHGNNELNTSEAISIIFNLLYKEKSEVRDEIDKLKLLLIKKEEETGIVEEEKRNVYEQLGKYQQLLHLIKEIIALMKI